VNVADEVFELFARQGAAAYYGEAVSITEHALQTAFFAEAAPPALVVAALLHDIGHFVQDAPVDIADWIADARHEEVGGLWLAERFAPQISEPVRLHVPAKRYLCATDPAYLALLSPASVHTLALQGGPMSEREVALFEAESFHRQAVRVRRWDDRGKIPGLATPALADYRAMIDMAARRAPP